MAADYRTMTLKTLALKVSEISESIRALSRAEREELLTEAAGRLILASYMLERDEYEKGPLGALFPIPSERELRRMLIGAPLGDFNDVEGIMNDLEARMGGEG